MNIKLIVIAVSALAGGICGVFGGIKMAKPAVCNCPEIPKCPPTNKIQTIDFDKLRRIKGNVTIEQVFNGDVYMITENDTIKLN